MLRVGFPGTPLPASVMNLHHVEGGNSRAVMMRTLIWFLWGCPCRTMGPRQSHLSGDGGCMCAGDDAMPGGSLEEPPVSSYLLSTSPYATVIAPPEGSGKGFWAGAPGAARDDASGAWCVFYYGRARASHIYRVCTSCALTMAAMTRCGLSLSLFCSSSPPDVPRSPQVRRAPAPPAARVCGR